jgi:polyphosphate kinase
MNNTYDYYEIDYSSLEKDVKGFPNASSKRPEEMYTRYNYPKIYIISERAMSDCKVELLPTNDVKITINLMAYLAIRCGGSWAKDEYNFRMPQAFTITEMTPQQNAIEDFIVHPGGNLNMLLQTPYDDFWGIIKSLQKTLDISTSKAQRVRVTGYRLGSDNPILDFVISMLNRNVPCDVYVELDARGEIENSIRELYNMVSSASLVEQKTGLEKLNLRLHYNDVKVHGKMICIDLVDGRSIVIFGTGNFNPQTTNVYKDYFYITSDPQVVDTINHNFDMIFNNTQPVLSSIAQLVLSEIYKEIAKGKDGKIYIQTNHLDNKLIVTALKEAIRRKCDVKLIVRTTKGFHKKDLPVVKTVVGKYLEHSRVYMFGKDSELRAYLSSSDLLYRNLYNRFESYIKVDKRTGMYLLINFLALYKEGQRYITGSGSTEVMPKPKPINMKKAKEKEKDSSFSFFFVFIFKILHKDIILFFITYM